ncbi:MAG: energy-coupling factor transporter transmembrane component T [Candidatus Binataceae bacterium]|jgi:energy-coupling factor transport system permease protein
MALYRYIERDTFVHRMHPTVKVIALIVMFWSVYWVDNPLALLPLGFLLLFIAVITGSSGNFYALRWLFIILITSTTLMWMATYRPGPAMVHMPQVNIRKASILFGLGKGIKLAELLAASVLFISTTKVEEFTIGLAKLRVPYRVGFAVSLSFRLAPLFVESALTIVDAQRLRGYEFGEGSIFERMRRYATVAVPVFMGALRKANSMAMALEARGFGRLARPTTYIDYPFRRADMVAFAALFAIGAGYFLIYWTGYGAVVA